jgi:branched-chain amino acid transport system permease protein
MAALRARLAGRDALVLAIVVAVAALVPFMVTTVSGREIAVRIALFALLGVAWNLMSGFAGQFSFGHAAYFGLGAYGSALVVVDGGGSPWIGMLVGAAAAALFGLATGYLSFRYKLRGAYFALATFAFAEMLRLIVQRAEPLNAGRGYRVPVMSESSLWMIQFPPGSAFYFWIALALFAGAMLVVILLMRSRAGSFIRAVREDEAAAEALGIDPMRYKLLAVGLSAAITAVGGAFYLQFFLFVNPELAFGSALSIQILLPAIIGGVGTIWGPALGAVAFVALGELSTRLIDAPPSALSFLEGKAGLDLAVYGAVLVAIIVLMPRGVVGALRGRTT